MHKEPEILLFDEWDNISRLEIMAVWTTCMS
jgi:hypothetical protein